MENVNRNELASTEGTDLGIDRTLDTGQRRVHPIVIYPFGHPKDTDHLRALYEALNRLCTSDGRFFKPLTVLNRQTVDRVSHPRMSPLQKKEAQGAFEKFLTKAIEPYSAIHRTWCVDTCQMCLMD